MNAYELVNKIRGDFFRRLTRKAVRRYSKDEIQVIFNESTLKVTLRELNEIMERKGEKS